LFQMVRETEREGENRQRRVGVAAGREDRTARDIEIGQPVRAAVLVHDAAAGIAVHPRPAEMVVRAGFAVGLRQRNDSPDPGALDLLSENALDLLGAALVYRAPAPMDFDLSLAERIAFRAERNAVLRVGGLLQVQNEFERSEAAGSTRQARPAVVFGPVAEQA